MAAPLMLAAQSPENVFVIHLLVVLATAALVAIVMQRMRLAVIPAYLIAGILVGPGSLRLVRSPESLQAIAQLAIVLLMFGVGLHLHLTVLGRSAWRMIAAGVGSCLLSIALGWPVTRAFGLSAPAGFAISMALSLSSTAVVLRLITERGELRHATGQLALSILVIQDLLVLAMLAALPVIARWAGSGGEMADAGEAAEAAIRDLPSFAWQALLRLGSIAALLVLGKILLPRLLMESARERTGEVMMIVSVAVAIGAGVAAHLLGFSMELGAFMAGFLLAGTPFRHQLTGQIAPLRNLFLAVFFTTLGMQIDPRLMMENWWIILLGGAAMSAIKIAAIGGMSWALGASGALAIAVALALAQAGEFSLVLLAATRQLDIINDLVADNAIAIVVISLVLTPALVDVGRRVSASASRLPAAPWISAMAGQSRERTKLEEENVNHVILGGYGQVGRAIAQALDTAGIHYTIIELNPDTVHELRRSGKPVVFGDVSNLDVLNSAGLHHADALVLSMPDEHAVLAASAQARQRRGEKIFIAARFSLAKQTKAASAFNLDHVTVEEVETARVMKDAVMLWLQKRSPQQKT